MTNPRTNTIGRSVASRLQAFVPWIPELIIGLFFLLSVTAYGWTLFAPHSLGLTDDDGETLSVYCALLAFFFLKRAFKADMRRAFPPASADNHNQDDTLHPDMAVTTTTTEN